MKGRTDGYFATKKDFRLQEKEHTLVIDRMRLYKRLSLTIEIDMKMSGPATI